MIRRLSRRKYNIFSFDVESHNDEESIAKRETSIWLGSFINEESKIDDENSYIYTIDEFLERLNVLSNPKRKHAEKRPCKNVCVYIFNLSFEWSFILPVMLQKGFSFSAEINKDSEMCYNTTSTKSCSSVWRVTMKIDKKGGFIELRDLAKIFGGSLRKVAKSFNLPTQKGDIDYRKNRLKYYDEYDMPHYYGDGGEPPRYTPTKEEKEYCFKDTKIVMDILEIMDKRQDSEFWNSTSMASYSMKKLLKRGYPRATRPYKEYRKEYPELSEEENAFLRLGVEGGITYAPSNWQFKDIKEKVAHCDYHQMHPSQMYKHLFPYGTGEYFKGKPKPSGLYISAVRIRISYSFVKLHSIIKLIGLPFVEDKEIVVWDFEIPTMKKCYENLEIEYIDGYRYKAKPLTFRQYVADNYKARLKAKAIKDEFNILYYKLLNNSSYGKFLEKPHNQIFKNIVRDDGVIDSIIIDKEADKINCNSKYTYLPVGSCIPAYSRVTLIEQALKIGWQKIVYFDTDSIFFIWDNETAKEWDKVDKTDFLGGCAMEEFLERCMFTAPKRYKKIDESGKLDVKMAGINNIDTSVPYDEINIVSSSWEVQRAFRCKGGTIIDMQHKDISVPNKYNCIYEKNSIQYS